MGSCWIKVKCAVAALAGLVRDWASDLREMKQGVPQRQVHTEVMEFLPAALEVQQRPPSPTGRVLLWSLLLLFSIAGVWMMIGKVDIVAVAQGKVIPSGKSKTVQSLVTGTVETIHVQDGQAVSQGEALITLNSGNAQADIAQIRDQLYRARAGLWRINKLLMYMGSDVSTLPLSLSMTGSMTGPHRPPAAAARSGDLDFPEHIRQAESSLASSQYQALLSEITSYTKRLKERESERRTLRSEMRKLKLQLPIVSRRVESHRALASRDHVSKDNLDVIEQQRIELEQNIEMIVNQELQLIASIDSVRSEQQSLIDTRNSALQLERQEFLARISQLEQELIKSEEMLERHVLTASVSGSVQQLSIHTVGGVVTPAEPLMTIVPENTQLEVEAMLANKDIGFVSVGQPVKVKVDAYPYTRYGALVGEIKSISADAVEVPNVGWVFSTTVRLRDTQLLVEGRDVEISPGMSVVTEIKTGKRRLIEYVLSPLMRYKDESVRER